MLRYIALYSALLAAGSGFAAEPVTTASLLRDMADLRHLVEYPDPAYQTVQYSSHDRRSQAPGGPDWFGNSDGFGGEPIPNFEAVLEEPGADGMGHYLMCDVEGPGAVVRTWTARIEGEITIWLDGGAPLYSGPAQDFLLFPYTTVGGEGFDGDALHGTFYQRNAAYCPMPFAKGCRIEWRGDLRKLHFYEVQLRRYAAGADVRTFSPEDLTEHAGLLQAVDRTLRDPDGTMAGANHQSSLVVRPGESCILYEREGSGVVDWFGVRLLDGVDEDTEVVAGTWDWRATVLRCYFDGATIPQVECPVGDLFGAAPGINPYTSLPFTVTPEGEMICRYSMPHAESLRMEVENAGSKTLRVEARLAVAPYAWREGQSMHFRARWRMDQGLVGSSQHPQDMPYLVGLGKGVYVGTALYVLNPNAVPSSGGNWWGEGDEKIFVDGESHPSIFGTGSEDYFNYAWSANDIFVFPFCGQPRNDGPANRGFVTNYRWHIVDPLPFEESMAFYMELFPHETVPDMGYARVAYHYALPGMMDDHVRVSPDNIREQHLPASWTPAARGAAARSAFFEVEEIVEPGAPVTRVAGPLWTGGSHVEWTPEKSDDTLILTVPVERAGDYLPRIGCARQPEAGQIEMRVDGSTPVAIDLHWPHGTLYRCFAAPQTHLTKGNHMVTLQFKGGGARIGLDMLWLQRR